MVTRQTQVIWDMHLTSCTMASSAPPHIVALLPCWPLLILTYPACALPGDTPSTDYATYANLDNRLVPLAPGVAALTLSFQGAANTSVAVSVEDTYQPSWPRATPADDTSALVTANMTAGAMVSVRLFPSMGLDLTADLAPEQIEGGGGVSLVADSAQGASFFPGQGHLFF